MAFSDFKEDKSRLDNWREYLNEAEEDFDALEAQHATELQKVEELVDGARTGTLYIDFDYTDLVAGPTWVFQAVISVAVPDEMRAKELDWRAEHAIEKEFERSAADYVDLTSEGRLPKPDFNAQHLNYGELQISWTVYGIEKLEGFIKDVEQMDNYFENPSVRAKLFAPLRKQAELALSEEKQRKFSDFKNDKKRMDNWRGFLNEQQEQPDGGSSEPSLENKRAWLEWHIQKSKSKNMGIALPQAKKAYAAAIKKAGMTEGVGDPVKLKGDLPADVAPDDDARAQQFLGQKFDQAFKRWEKKARPAVGEKGWSKMRQTYIAAALKYAKKNNVTYATEGVADGAGKPAALKVFKQLPKKSKQQAAPQQQQQQQKKQQEQPDGGSSRPSLKNKSAWLKWHIENSGTTDRGMAHGRAKRAYAKAIKKAGMTEGINDLPPGAKTGTGVEGYKAQDAQQAQKRLGQQFEQKFERYKARLITLVGQDGWGKMRQAFINAALKFAKEQGVTYATKGVADAAVPAAMAVFKQLPKKKKKKQQAAPQQQQKKQKAASPSGGDIRMPQAARSDTGADYHKKREKIRQKYLYQAIARYGPGSRAIRWAADKANAEMGRMQEGHDCAVHKRKGLTHKQWEKSQQEEVHVDPGNLNEFMRLIREEVEVVLSDAEAKEFFGDDALSSGNLQEQMDMEGWLKQQIQNGIRDAKLQGEAAAKFEAAVLAKYGKRRFSSRRIHSWTKNIQLMARALQEENRTAAGNITQDARKKHATVGKDKFPIFDKESADAAIDLRGHAPAGDRAKIIDKAAKFDPTAAKKARKADKKDKN